VKKLILAGDPMQLPPTILSTKKTNTDEKKSKTPKSISKMPKKKQEDMPVREDSGSSTSESDSSDAVGNKGKKAGIKPSPTLETTLFDRLEKMYGPSIKRMLDVQYRCACFL
jgi:DNA polymerase alpha-associated DNA helicase A